MTKIRTDGPNNLMQTDIFVILSPASGAQSVSVTWGGGTPGNAVGGSITLSGVTQSTTPDAQNGANGASGNPTVSLTTVADNAWIIDTVALRTAASETLTMVSHTNRTQRWNVLTQANGARGAGSTLGPATPPGSFTMDWTQSGTGAWAISAASFAPAGAAAAKNRLPLLGVGD